MSRRERGVAWGLIDSLARLVQDAGIVRTWGAAVLRPYIAVHTAHTVRSGT